MRTGSLHALAQQVSGSAAACQGAPQIVKCIQGMLSLPLCRSEQSSYGQQSFKSLALLVSRP